MLTKQEETILEMLKNNRQLSVGEVAIALEISAVTARKILDSMASQSLLRRIHGGAIFLEKRKMKSFIQRETLHIKEKRAIARKACSLLNPDQTVFCNAGTSVLEFLKIVKAEQVRQIITTNVTILNSPFAPLNKILFTGGQVNEEASAFCGDVAQYNVSNLFVDVSLIGVTGFDLDKGLTALSMSSVMVDRTMIENTIDKVYVLADSSKIGKISGFFTAPIDKVKGLIVDDKITDEQRRKCESIGIEVIIA